MTEIKTIEGHLQADGLKFAIVASRFNDLIVRRLIDGAIDFLIRHGADKNNLTLLRVPGAFEIPKAVKFLAQSNNYDGIICLGALIRGDTPHFDLLANETVKGLAHIDLEFKTPIGLGILTTDSIEQAIERAGTKAGNKGAEAANACLEMAQVLKKI
jgi:6,7-dimethyl-8-ribityllumazine synthase